MNRPCLYNPTLVLAAPGTDLRCTKISCFGKVDGLKLTGHVELGTCWQPFRSFLKGCPWTLSPLTHKCPRFPREMEGQLWLIWAGPPYHLVLWLARFLPLLPSFHLNLFLLLLMHAHFFTCTCHAIFPPTAALAQPVPWFLSSNVI